MTTEMEMMAYAIILAFAQFVLYAVPGVAQTGVDYALSSRDEDRPLTGFAGRARRAFYNHLETLPLFIGAVALLVWTGSANEGSALGAQIYFFNRLAYVPAYVFGVVYVRSILWMAAMVGICMTLAQSLL